MAEDGALREQHVDAPRPDDLVDPRDRLGAEDQGRDGPRAADPEDAVDTGQPGGHEHQGMQLPVALGGTGDDHLAHAGHARRHRGHVQRRRKWRASRDVDAHSVQWQHSLAQRRPIERVLPALRDPVGVEPPYAVAGAAYRGDVFVRRRREGGLDLRSADLQIGRR